MKKLEKLTLNTSESYFKLQPASLLSQEELMQMYAGSGPNECFFDGLSFLSQYYSNSSFSAHDTDYYFDSYYNFYGSGGFSYDASGEMQGMKAANGSSFASMFFSTYTLSGRDVATFVNPSTGATVLTSINIQDSNGVQLTHAVVLMSQNADGTYNAKDATSGQMRVIDQGIINPTMLIGINGNCTP